MSKEEHTFCVRCKLMSVCVAEKGEHETCKRYEKATRLGKCMYLRPEINNHCDCLQAQQEASKTPYEIKQRIIITERR